MNPIHDWDADQLERLKTVFARLMVREVQNNAEDKALQCLQQLQDLSYFELGDDITINFTVKTNFNTLNTLVSMMYGGSK